MSEVAAPLGYSERSDIARDVVLIGASAGGIDAIGTVVGALPATLNAIVAITLHRGVGEGSMLRSILAARLKLEIVEPRNGEPLQHGRAYLAPPDHHLVFAAGMVILDHGPKERHARPSIDVMFRSGARHFGPRVVGVVMTGHLDDGAAGLREIKEHGGLSLAQEPAEARAPSMPRTALLEDDVDIVFRLAAGAQVLEKLVAAKGVAVALRTPGARRPEDEPLFPDG